MSEPGCRTPPSLKPAAQAWEKKPARGSDDGRPLHPGGRVPRCANRGSDAQRPSRASRHIRIARTRNARISRTRPPRSSAALSRRWFGGPTPRGFLRFFPRIGQAKKKRENELRPKIRKVKLARAPPSRGRRGAAREHWPRRRRTKCRRGPPRALARRPAARVSGRGQTPVPAAQQQSVSDPACFRFPSGQPRHPAKGRKTGTGEETLAPFSRARVRGATAGRRASIITCLGVSRTEDRLAREEWSNGACSWTNDSYYSVGFFSCFFLTTRALFI